MNNTVKDENDNIGQKLNDILTFLMNKHHISLTTIHRNTGIAIPTIKRLQSDPSSNPTVSTLLPIANFFGLNINQLIGAEPIREEHNLIVPKENIQEIPLITWKEASLWPNLIEKDLLEKNYILTDVEAGTKPYALIVEEDDWIGFLKNSILIIDTETEVTHKDYVIVHKSGQELPTMKQVLMDEGKIYLKPLNPIFQTSLFDKTHEFLGVLVQVKSNLKNY